jgi:hypothetical protein
MFVIFKAVEISRHDPNLGIQSTTNTKDTLFQKFMGMYEKCFVKYWTYF